MKKILVLLVSLLVFTIFFTGCNNLTDRGENEMNSNASATGTFSETNYPLIELHADWIIYATKEEVVDASTNIFTGRIVDVSFEIIDMETGKVDRDNMSESRWRMLYTVYTISVTNSIKGDNPSEVKVRIMGGKPGYQEREQYELVQTSGLISKYEGIPVCTECKSAVALLQDKTYLFCTVRFGEEFDCMINPTQFAYPADSEDAQLISKLCR